MKKTEEKVIKIVSDLTVMDEELSLDERLAEIGIDSLKMVELVVSLEDEFGIQFSDSDLDPSGWLTIADVAVLVSKTLPI